MSFSWLQQLSPNLFGDIEREMNEEIEVILFQERNSLKFKDTNNDKNQSEHKITGFYLYKHPPEHRPTKTFQFVWKMLHDQLIVLSLVINRKCSESF